MNTPDWRKLTLNDGVLQEPMPGDNHLVLWLPGPREDGFQYWERINKVARAEPTAEHGIGATPALAIRARQRVRGLFGKLWPRFGKDSGDQNWVLPNGETAEQCGARHADVVLAWALDGEPPLDEGRIKARWPAATRCQPIGKNLCLVFGVEPPPAEEAAGPPPSLECPRATAQQLLAAARGGRDRQREVSALVDLGIIDLNEGNARTAVTQLEQALAIARELVDPGRELDVLGNLGMATMSTGQVHKALALFEQELAQARALNSPFGEKMAMTHLGFAQGNLRNHFQAIAHFDEALAMARSLGDRKHEPELLWYESIQYAELGQREQAIAKAQEAIAFQEKVGNPQAKWFAFHLNRYQLGAKEIIPAAAADAGGGWIVAGAAMNPPTPGQTAAGPGLLRMALSAAASMAKFLGSGMKMVTPGLYQKRIQTCATCEHHTGVRCRLCGCFTNVKARMPHEQCPIKKWPA
jgi:tetratricopeptide (TPR) repeat protein